MIKKIAFSILVMSVWGGFALGASAQTATLNGVVSPSLKVSPVSTSFSKSVIVRELQLGNSGDDVKKLQALLGASKDVYPEGLVSGYFGTLTKNAVKNFQVKNKLAVTERLDAETLRKINEMLNKNTAPLFSGISAVNVVPNTTELSWKTNIPATTRIYYSTGEVFSKTGTTWTVNVNYLSLDHVIDVTHLQPGTKYNYVLASSNASGTATTSAPFSFTTATSTATSTTM